MFAERLASQRYNFSVVAITSTFCSLETLLTGGKANWDGIWSCSLSDAGRAGGGGSDRDSLGKWSGRSQEAKFKEPFL